MRITEKGQVTIPIDIRWQLGLTPGDEVEFVVEGETARLRRSANAPSRGRKLVDRLLTHQTDAPMSTDEIMALTRGE